MFSLITFEKEYHEIFRSVFKLFRGYKTNVAGSGVIRSEQGRAAGEKLAQTRVPRAVTVVP